MFKAVLADDRTALERLGRSFMQQDRRAAALLCLDQRFAHFPNIQVMSATEISPILDLFDAYIKLLTNIASSPTSCNLSGVQRLFNFKMATQNVFLLAPGSYLHSEVMRGRTRVQSSSDEGFLINYADLLGCLQHTLKFRIRSRILDENEACYHAKAFISPCLASTVLGSCTRSDCSRAHLPQNDLTPEWYNAQIRIFLQHFLILRAFPSSGPADEHQIGRR